MGRFQFESPTPEQAKTFLSWRRRNEEYQGELHSDAVVCVRRLRPVITPRERVLIESMRGQPRAEVFTCASCGNFAFSRPTICYWCANDLRGSSNG